MALGPIKIAGIYFGKNGKMYLYNEGLCPDWLFLKIGDQWLKFRYMENRPEDIRMVYAAQVYCNFPGIYELAGNADEPGEKDFVCKNDELFLTLRVASSKFLTLISQALAIRAA